MGSDGAESIPRSGKAAPDRNVNRSLFATAAVLAVAALVACWFGTRAVIDGIVNHEGREAARHWAAAFTHLIGDADGIKPGDTIRGRNLDIFRRAIEAGDIFRFRIFDSSGTVVAASRPRDIGRQGSTPEFDRFVRSGETYAMVERRNGPNGTITVSKAGTPLMIGNRFAGGIEVYVDVSARVAWLERLRYMAFFGLMAILACVTGILGAAVSGTLRRHAKMQADLAHSESQHRRLLDEAPDAMVIHNQREILYANDAALRLYGAERREDLLGVNPDRLVPADKLSEIRENRQKSLASGRGWKSESLQRLRLDGSLVEADSVGIPVDWDDQRCILIQSHDMTAQRRAQRAIAAREAQLTAFMEHSQSMMMIKSIDGRLLMVNRRFAEFYDLPTDRMIGSGGREWSSPENIAAFSEQDRLILVTGQPSTIELPVDRGDGVERTIRHEKFPIRNADGEIDCLGCVSTDITEIREREEVSRQALAAAEEAKAQLAAFFDNSPSGMYLKDRDCNLIMVNPAFEKFYGVTAAEVIGKPIRDWMPKHVADKAEALDREIFHSGELLFDEVGFETAGGDIRNVIFNKFPITAGDGAVVGVGGFNTDVTEARRQEAAIRDSQARLTAYIDHIPMMVMLLDRDSRILMINSRHEEFFGYRAEDIVGHDGRDLVRSDLFEMFAAENRRICDRQEGLERILEIENAEGEMRLLRQTKFPIVTDGNEAIAVGMIMTDITEQILHERELEQARDAAEAANRAKSAFLANMSHEIRTPMNGVFGMADLLAQSALTADQQRYLTTIRRSGEALLGVINNVLDVSRIEAGEFRLDVTGFNLHDLVADAVELFAEAATAKGIVIAHNIAASVPARVEGDDVRLRQVLINLIGNAVKFTSDGEVVVRVARVGGSAKEALIRFEVTDTGVGITREQQVILFDSFQQADTSITRRFGGSGLGLSIAQHITGLMGGRIDIDSEPDHGSSFVFTIPLSLSAAAPAGGPPPGDNLAGKRLLFVDDNAVNREILTEFARDWDAEFTVVASADDAQSAILDATRGERPFDAALLDIVMPQMDGLELARWIRSQPAAADTKLIALTSFNWDRDSAASREAGFAQFATKPIRRPQLARLIDDVLAGRTPAAGDDGAAYPAAGERPALPAYDAKVLLVEDNLVNRELAQEYLDRLGCSVVAAGDGGRAVDLFTAGRFDLVLMDVQMPVMDGIEATRRIRDIEARKNAERAPVVAATAHAFQEDREKCILAGMDDFLSKPYTLTDLVPLLDRWLAPTKRRTDPPRRAAAAAAAAAAPAELLDGAKVAELRALDTSGENRILRKVADIFLRNTPAELEKLKAHVASGNCAGVALVTHSLKTSAANVAALTLSERFRDLEAAARRDDVAACTDIAADVLELYDAVAAALRREAEAPAPARRTA